MKRKIFRARPNFVEEHRGFGFDFGECTSPDGLPYWTEEAGYEFTLSQIDAIEDASNELHQLCMEFVGDVVSTGDYPEEYYLSNDSKEAINTSWNRKDPHLYGRFDLGYDNGKLRLLEYNADTPTGLLEASVAQWHWVENVPGILDQDRDQFNSIHDALIERWGVIGTKLPMMNKLIHFCATTVAGREDWGTLQYLIDTAVQAGINAHEMPMEDMVYDQPWFLDSDNTRIAYSFKLYPWEWMMQEEFSVNINTSPTRWIEPAWKMLLSNKALLVQLWKKYGNECEYLLPTFINDNNMPNNGIPATGKWVVKPLFGREGANIAIFEDGNMVYASDTYVQEYNKGHNVIQEFMELPSFDGAYPIIGSWIVGDKSVGIGVREGGLITANNSHFVPHYFIDSAYHTNMESHRGNTTG